MIENQRRNGEEPIIKREKLDYLDILRGFAILAVLAIHTTSQPVASAHLRETSSLYPLYHIVNAGAHFAVPSFLFLSALVLFYNYYGRSGTDWVAFYRRRLLTIVVPYALWSLFYFLVRAFASHSPVIGRLDVFAEGLWRGTNYTHLYFIVIIVQFYLLFPLLLQLTRFSWVRSCLVPIGAVLQTAFYLGNYYSFHMERGDDFLPLGSFVGSYAFYLFLGMYAGLKLQQKPDWLRRPGWLLYVSFLALGIAYIGQLWMLLRNPSDWIGKPWSSRINFATDYAYAGVCCLMLVHLSRRLWEGGKGALRRALVSLGATSFGIYFLHPFFLLVWRHEVAVGHPIGYHAAVWTGGLLALVLSWVISWVLQKWKWGGWIIGK